MTKILSSKSLVKYLENEDKKFYYLIVGSGSVVVDGLALRILTYCGSPALVVVEDGLLKSSSSSSSSFSSESSLEACTESSVVVEGRPRFMVVYLVKEKKTFEANTLGSDVVIKIKHLLCFAPLLFDVKAV